MGKNMIPYTFAIGEKCTSFTSTHYKFIENDKIEEDMLLNSTIGNLDPYDYYLSKNGLDCFKKLLDCKRIHSSWLCMESGDMKNLLKMKRLMKKMLKYTK